jgi:hypothetical protein
MVKQDTFMNDVRDRNVSTVCLGFYDCWFSLAVKTFEINANISRLVVQPALQIWILLLSWKMLKTRS